MAIPKTNKLLIGIVITLIIIVLALIVFVAYQLKELQNHQTCSSSACKIPFTSTTIIEGAIPLQSSEQTMTIQQMQTAGVYPEIGTTTTTTTTSTTTTTIPSSGA